MAAVFNHTFVHLQALLRENEPETRILLTTHPIWFLLCETEKKLCIGYMVNNIRVSGSFSRNNACKCTKVWLKTAAI